MRIKIAIKVTTLLFLVLGVVLLGIAVFAFHLGLDHNLAWGKSRFLLAGVGSLLLFCALALRAGPPVWKRFDLSVRVARFTRAVARSSPAQVVKRLWRWWAALLEQLPLYGYFRRHPLRLALLYCGAGVVVVVLVYIWYLTSGTMTVWTPYTTYFDKLGSAFYAGQLALLEQPPEVLLALENPYDYRNREGIGYLWDASLYHGRYYYYWGPVPALAAWAVKVLAGPGVVVEDQYLVFAFASGLNLISALLLLRLRAVFFPGAPNWSLLPLVLLAGLAAPVFWLINRPSVYEVAIAGGQFFLFLGLYAAIQYATRTKPSPGWLLAAGLAWGAAVNCRLNLGLAVGFFAIMAAWSVIQARKSAWASLSALAWLGIPLLLWAGGMAWYNYARFGSLLETGHRYQLTGMTLTSDYRATFSAAYILPSLYNYLLRTFHFDFHDFPFVFAPFIREDMWPWWIKLPENYYYPEPVAGLLTAVPVLWVAFLPLFGWVRAGWLWLNERPPAARPHTASTWLWVWLAGGFACLFAPLLLFTTNSMRYLADVVPLLVLLAALGWWKGLLYVQHRPVWRGFLSLAVLILIVVSIGMSLLVAFGVGDKRFEANNPALYFQLAHFFLGTAP